jgi:hypothetical protein
MAQKDLDALLSDIQSAQDIVKIGEIYSHYKDQTKFYKIVGYTVIESLDEIAVIYQPLYVGKEITFTRPFSEFISSVEWEGNMVKRFTKVELSYGI